MVEAQFRLIGGVAGTNSNVINWMPDQYLLIAFFCGCDPFKFLAVFVRFKTAEVGFQLQKPGNR
jgi:hypothetical protein